MGGAPLSSQQSGGISLPKVERFVRRIEAGEIPPPIKVDKGIIVDGNHRYVALRLCGKEPQIQDWSGGRPARVVPWSELKISPDDWGD